MDEMPQADIRQQIVDRLKQATNILVTVRNNPTVDLLSACIGLALALDKIDKHAAAVFSGQVPAALEFLKPEQTIEQTPDSLRDFIIALDKSKADKLRYKVEDTMVRIFITPYKTSISQGDLEFSQGDFNVDVVVALGAHEQQELDQAITTHGRILHDATVISINNTPSGNLGVLSWQELGASSISEMAAQLIQDLDSSAMDEQIATAFLTGIVAETDRFSNERTMPQTMTLAGDLIAAGANQHLVAASLQASEQAPAPLPIAAPQEGKLVAARPSAVDADGTLNIDHEEIAEEPEEKRAVAGIDAAPEPLQTKGAEEQEEPETPKIIPSSREILPVPGPARAIGGSPRSLSDMAFTADGLDDDDVDEALPPDRMRSYLVDEPMFGDGRHQPTTVAEPSKSNPFDVPVSEPSAPLLTHDAPATSQPGSAGASATALPSVFPSSPAPVLVSPAPIFTSPTPMTPMPMAPTPPTSPAPPIEPMRPPETSIGAPVPFSVPTPPPAIQTTQPHGDAVTDGQTLSDIEKAVDSAHLHEADDINRKTDDVDAARNQVWEAFQHAEPEHADAGLPLPEPQPQPQPQAQFALGNGGSQDGSGVMPLGGPLHPRLSTAAPSPQSVALPNMAVDINPDGTFRQAAPQGPMPAASSAVGMVGPSASVVPDGPPDTLLPSVPTVMPISPAGQGPVSTTPTDLPPSVPPPFMPQQLPPTA